MAFEGGDSLRDLLSIVLFTVIAALVALLLWVLLRRHQRFRRELQRNQDAATMAEPSAARRSSMTPSLDAAPVTSGSRRPSVVRIQLEAPMTPTLDAAPVTSGSRRPSVVRIAPEVEVATYSPVAKGPSIAEVMAAKAAGMGSSEEATPVPSVPRAELTGQPVAPALKRRSSLVTPGSSRRSSLKDNGRRRSLTKPPEVAAIETSATSVKTSKPKDRRRGSGSAGGSRSPSRRTSLQRSQTSQGGKASSSGGKSSSEMLPVAALLIRRPSTDSKSSNRSNRSTRYVGDKPKVPPALDIFSREHSSMAESPPTVPVPPVTTEPTKAGSKSTK